MKNSNFLLRPNLPAYVMIVPAFLLFYNQLIAQYYYIPDQNYRLSGNSQTCHGVTTEKDGSQSLIVNNNTSASGSTPVHCSPNIGVLDACSNGGDYLKQPKIRQNLCDECIPAQTQNSTSVVSNVNYFPNYINEFSDDILTSNAVTVQVILQKDPTTTSAPPEEIRCFLYCFSNGHTGTRGVSYVLLDSFSIKKNTSINPRSWETRNNSKACYQFGRGEYLIFRFRTTITNPNLIAVVQEKSTNGSWPDSPSSQFSAINSVTDLENYVRNNSNVAWKKLQNPPNCISIPQPETEPENVKFEVANFFKKLCERPGANFTVCVGKILAKNIPDIKKYVDFSLDISDVPKEKLPFIQNLVRMNEGRLQYDASQALISMKWSSPQDAITIPADILDAISPSNLNLQVKSRQKLPCEYLSYSFSLEQWQINPDTKKESLIDSQEVVFFSDPRDIKDCRCQLFWRRLLDIFRPQRPNGLKKG